MTFIKPHTAETLEASNAHPLIPLVTTVQPASEEATEAPLIASDPRRIFTPLFAYRTGLLIH
jgi:hypothetical protein